MIGDGLQSKYIPVMSSPLNPLDARRTPLRAPISPFTPAKSSPLSKRMITGRVLGFDKRRSVSDSNLRPALVGVPKPMPTPLFYNGPLPVPTTDRVDFNSDQEHDCSSHDDDYTTVDVESLPKLENPFAAWLDIRDENLLQDNLPSGSTITESPVARPSGVVSLKFASSLEAPLWPRRPSGFGLGLGIGAVENVTGERLHISCSQAINKNDFSIRVFDREMTDPPSSQDDLDEHELLTQQEDVFSSAAPPLKRRKTIDVLL